MSDEVIVGIDLGTTFSAIAVLNEHGRPEIIPNREGKRTTPSVIFFEDDGNPIVGEEARNQAIIAPRRTVRFVKREMGNPSFRYDLDGKEFFPEDLSALILKKLKADAEAHLGCSVTKAVISVPAYFKDAQREATRQAGVIAGLEVARIINEPTAAALAYGLDLDGDDQTILVYDFGGGTFDVTLMRKSGREFTILATDGDSKLGGKDIDARLVEHLAEEFLRAHDVDLRVEPHSHQDLWDRAERVKKDLSFRENVAEVLSAGTQTLRIDVDRSEFVELIQDLIDRTRECMTKVVADADVSWKDVDAVVLAGGSSRIPAVREMIAEVTGSGAARDLNPDECVALGAALQAALSSDEGPAAEVNSDGSQRGGAEAVVDIVVHDVASHSLGVKARSPDRQQYVNSIIIPRLTPVPCDRTRTYTTHEDNQKKVEIIVLQGEDGDANSPAVSLVGKVSLTDLPPHKAGDLVIEVTLAYDANGVIEVTAQETMSGRMTRETVMRKSGGLSKEILDEKKTFVDEAKV